MTVPLIFQRLDAALERAAEERIGIRAIYLCPSDLALFDRAMTARYRRANGSTAKVHACDYRGHILRRGKCSRIYSDHGVSVRIPKKPGEARS